MRCLGLLTVALVLSSCVTGDPRYARDGRAVWYNPDAMRVIQTADEVYILPVTLSDKNGEMNPPHGDYRHMRLLDADARGKLQRLLGTESNWFHGSDNTVGTYDSRTVGFVFRKRPDKLVLLCGLGWRLEGKFNSEPTSGSLEEKPFDQLEKWKKQYAKPELASR